MGRVVALVPLPVEPPGPRRLAAIRAALAFAPASERILLFDPGLPPKSVAALQAFLQAASVWPAAAAVVPVKDTYKEVVAGVVRSTVPRDQLFQLQRVIVVDRPRFEEALESNAKSGWGCSDELSLCGRAGIRVQLIPGEYTLPAAAR